MSNDKALKLQGQLADLDAFAQELGDLIGRALQANIPPSVIRSATEDILSLAASRPVVDVEVGPGNAEGIADEDAALTECQIWIGNDHSTYDQAEATKAVEVVLGPGRTLRLAEDGLGWMVELRGLELDVLRLQGFIDLEKYSYRIIGSE